MVRLMLYRNQPDDKHYFDNIIYGFQKWQKDSNPEHVHVELGFDDGVMFSSTGRGGFLGQGTRFADSNAIDLEKWDIFILKTDKEDDIRDMCKLYCGHGYDWFGILGMALPFNLQIGFQWYCSEICNHILSKTDVVKPNKKIRPGQILKSYTEQRVL